MTLPLSAPALVITVLFSLMSGWSEFTVARALLASIALMTLPPGLASLFTTYQTRWADHAAGFFFSVTP